MGSLRGRLAGGFVLGLAAASLAAQSESPARVRTRSYFFEEAGRQSDYKLLVSSKYREGIPAPFILALHPFGTAPQGIMLYQGLRQLADERGYIVAAPTGYDLRVWHAADAARGRGRGRSAGELSELDAMNVLAEVRRTHTIDPARIFLMGHSMGGGAVWHFGKAYPDLWAALAPVAPATAADPDGLEALVDTPVIVVQGTADQSVPVSRTRRWVDRMRELGMTYEYVEVPGGDHTSIISRSPETMRRIFDFFDRATRE